LTRLAALLNNSRKRRITDYKLMNLTSKIAKLSVLFVVVTLVAVGCSSTKPSPVPWNVSIKKATAASIRVDVVGVHPSQKPYWENIKVGDYWKENSPIRNQAKKEVVKFEGNPPAWTLPRDSKIWTDWFNSGSVYLMIIADLPGSSFADGPFDRRRLIVPLDKKIWKAKNKTLEFEIQDAMINVLTPQYPRD